MIRIVVTGSKGRMGSRIVKMISESEDLKLVAGVDKGDSLEAVIGGADVAIDFSAAEATAEHVRISEKHKKPIVIGTTGLGPEQEATIEEASSKIAIVRAPNMSVGVNVMWRIIETAARTLSDGHDIDIVETHHARKLDRPSGTAKRIAEIAHRISGRDVTAYEEIMPARNDADRSIRVLSIRKGDVVGDHEIEFRNENEVLSIRHRAENRDIFAAGALAAARWIIGKAPGLYGMDDVLF